MPPREARWARAFSENSVDLAIYARGMSLQSVLEILAAALNVQPDSNQVFSVLKARERPFHIVVDALDEAKEPILIARKILKPMHLLDNVKLLVGTRPEYVGDLDSSVVLINIDQRKYTLRKDIATYVAERLLSRREARKDTPYRKQVAYEIAQAVADKAYPNFLIAQLTAEDLLASPKKVDLEFMQKNDFPSTVIDAFARYLARFGPDEQKVYDLLTPLAWAEGLGLPWGELWAPLASALSERTYGDLDICWLLDHAGSFILESLEQSRSVYRAQLQVRGQGQTKQGLKASVDPGKPEV
jgi:hypothetical protein